MKGEILSLLPVRFRRGICKAEVMFMFGRVPSTLAEVSFSLGDSHYL